MEVKRCGAAIIVANLAVTSFVLDGLALYLLNSFSGSLLSAGFAVGIRIMSLTAPYIEFS
jgi:hypothetical protein